MPPDDTSPPDTPPGVSKGHKWVTISEAVGLTGKSERTIRRYIADGSLSNRRERGRRLVNLADILEDEPVMSGPPESPGVTGKADQDCLAEVRRLSDINAILERELEDWKRQAMGLTANQQKLIEATIPPARRWRWPWSKSEG